MVDKGIEILSISAYFYQRSSITTNEELQTNQYECKININFVLITLLL